MTDKALIDFLRSKFSSGPVAEAARRLEELGAELAGYKDAFEVAGQDQDRNLKTIQEMSEDLEKAQALAEHRLEINRELSNEHSYCEEREKAAEAQVAALGAD